MTSTLDVGAEFSAAQTGAAERLVLERLEGAQLAFLGGSLAVGLGTATSDVDLYVVGSRLRGEASFEQDGVEVHVNAMSGGEVRKLIELGSDYRATGADRSQLTIPLESLSGLVRLLTGRQLMITPAWARDLSRLDARVVRRILISRNANVFSACAEDVFGALSSGDVYTAVAASGLALEAACEAILAAAGDVYVGAKFLFRRLDRTPVTQPWCRPLWRLLNTAFGAAAEPLPEAAETVVRQRLLAGNLLLATAAIEGWDQPLAALPPIPSEYRHGPRRSPYFAPVRFADGWALIGPGDGYEVSEETVRLWQELTGRGLPADAHPDPAVAVSELHRVGAVESDLPVPDAAGERFVRPSPRFSCRPRQDWEH